MDVQENNSPPSAWLSWGQPVENSHEQSSFKPKAPEPLRVDSPVSPENRNQLRNRLLQMIVSSEQSRKAHSSTR
ncbi:hypothetical protein [Adhaeretor mobilis]|uniref:Uncharacterized protein n=1 Tax=Adhaeretor mobilis TaxID=1930276 RepID=A0A517MZ92_9BACT|nr:hypothetical protein [Adhaeretor mobilis]QDT00202.1 hypothetical protein HG15A2_35370 [Adhaeretor mobilis]